MSARSASASDDQTTGRSASAMARVQLCEEFVDVERHCGLPFQHANTPIDLDTQLQQPLDIGGELPPQAFLIRRRQILHRFDREFERSDHRSYHPPDVLAGPRPSATAAPRETRSLAS